MNSSNQPEIRPWGNYQILEESSQHKVKHISVLPGHQLSYQYHLQRSEVWIIVKGNPDIVLEGHTSSYKPGDVIQIPQGAKHRICNFGSEVVEFIEVQLGTYFGEDDIVRLEDDYNRI